MPARTLARIVGAAGLAIFLAGPARATQPTQDVTGVTLVAGRPQRDAVVWLPGVPGPPPPARIVLDQRNMAFVPHVLAVRVGTRVEMPNHDRVFHNVFSFRDGKRFDLGLYPAGATRIVQFDRAGLSRIFCNIHPTMAAYVLAVDAVHIAVSDESGRFSFAGLPGGVHEFRAWRPGADTISGTFTVPSPRALEIGWP